MTITLNIIKKSSKNLSAYPIFDKFQKLKTVDPTPVYRSLDFLIKRGIIQIELILLKPIRCVEILITISMIKILLSANPAKSAEKQMNYSARNIFANY